jgi:hypothetical protein
VQVITVFVRHSSDLARIHPPTLLHMCTGSRLVGLYFLWPTCFQDSADMPGYVSHTAQLQLMANMEATGVVTKFPHHSHLYRLLLSKDWCCHLCLMPGYNIPASTKVSRGIILDDAPRAAQLAHDALQVLSCDWWCCDRLFLCGSWRCGCSWCVQSANSIPPRLPPETLRCHCSLLLVHSEGLLQMRGVVKVGYSWEAMDVRTLQGILAAQCVCR